MSADVLDDSVRIAAAGCRIRPAAGVRAPVSLTGTRPANPHGCSGVRQSCARREALASGSNRQNCSR